MESRTEREIRMETHILEVNLIAAQGLKQPFIQSRPKTYAVVWVDPTKKVRSQIDKIDGENPSWNDKFTFKVSDDFIRSEISAISVELYTVGVFRDKLIGSVRLLISNFFAAPSSRSERIVSMKSWAFTALQVRRPSGSFHGAINMCAMVINGKEFAALGGTLGICQRNESEEYVPPPRQGSSRKSKSLAKEYNRCGSGRNCSGRSRSRSIHKSGMLDPKTPSSSALKERSRHGSSRKSKSLAEENNNPGSDRNSAGKSRSGYRSVHKSGMLDSTAPSLSPLKEQPRGEIYRKSKSLLEENNNPGSGRNSSGKSRSVHKSGMLDSTAPPSSALKERPRGGSSRKSKSLIEGNNQPGSIGNSSCRSVNKSKKRESTSKSVNNKSEKRESKTPSAAAKEEDFPPNKNQKKKASSKSNGGGLFCCLFPQKRAAQHPSDGEGKPVN